MAIQLPNPGLGDGQTGDNEFVMWTKVKDNFSNTAHAANRLVGIDLGNVAEVTTFGVARTGWGGASASNKLPTHTQLGVSQLESDDKLIQLLRSGGSGIYRFDGYISGGFTADSKLFPHTPLIFASGTDTFFTIQANLEGNKLRVLQGNASNYSSPRIQNIYTDRNTTKDVATGFLKASSPVLHVYNDSITKIHEAEQLDITVDKKGVGHYEIHGTTGLRKNDGWNMSPPRDLHGNVLCMIDVTEKDGVVILKTYKKKFDFETVSIVHDYDNPMDIPEGSCVEFRFNDLPEELTNEPIE